MNFTRKFIAVSNSGLSRNFSVSAANNATHSCKLLIIGGGSGGCTIASKFARRLPKDSVIVLEPSTEHFYQPLWTLVGAGICTLNQSRRLEESVLPSKAKWIKDYAESVHPDKCCVETRDGHVINYEYIVIASGIHNDYAKIPGLSEALQDKTSGVSTIYSADYAGNTYKNMQKFQKGEAVFTYPDTPIKCPGAPQKIAYLTDSYFRKSGVRSKANITYNTCLPVIFGVPKYAEALLKVVKRKDINVNYHTVLTEVRHDRKEAVFVDKNKQEKFTMNYDMLHVAPPMQTARFLRENSDVTDQLGYLSVDKHTLQHTKYKNMYGIGDCTNTPNSKTAAAIAKQCYVLEHNLLATMKQDSPQQKYDGYGACPLVTSPNTCITAEFIYDGIPRETLPWNQAKESVLAFYMKRHLFPFLYWNLMLKGYYHGPETIRKIINPFGL